MEQKLVEELRPFDLRSADMGAAVCTEAGQQLAEFIAGPTSVTRGLIMLMDHHVGGRVSLYDPERLRMAPLIWVDGHPAYSGDKLVWHCVTNSIKCVLQSVADSHRVFTEPDLNCTIPTVCGGLKVVVPHSQVRWPTHTEV